MSSSLQQKPTLPQRLGPRPLPLHLAMEGWILQMSLNGLMPSNDALPLWKQFKDAWMPAAFPMQGQKGMYDPARRVAAEALGKSPETFNEAWATALDAPQFLAAVTDEAHKRMERFMRGVMTYQYHPHHRRLEPPPAVWQRGVATLCDYGGPTDAPPVLFVPSLINRAYILDLSADRSLLRNTAKDLRTYLLDWGDPGDAEKQFTAEDYIDGVLIPALEEIKARTGQAPRLVGYCMGGTLSVAAAVLRPDLISKFVLLATPWDFHVDSEPSRMMLTAFRPMFESILAANGCAPVDLLQALFASLDPTLVGRKFRGFAALDSHSDAAIRFIELEDWANDGIPLAGPVARECLFEWYDANVTANRAWRINDTIIDPARIARPTLAILPTRDRIVPPESALRLAAAIPKAEQRKIGLGHIGMIVGNEATAQVHAPLIAWLKA